MGKHSGKSSSFPPTAGNPRHSGSARRVSQGPASPAPKMKRPRQSLPGSTRRLAPSGNPGDPAGLERVAWRRRPARSGTPLGQWFSGLLNWLRPCLRRAARVRVDSPSECDRRAAARFFEPWTGPERTTLSSGPTCFTPRLPLQRMFPPECMPTLGG